MKPLFRRKTEVNGGFQPRDFDENRREKKSKTIRAREMHQKEAREYRLYFPSPPKK